MRFMQENRHATRPQMAAALGLSLVSANAAVAALEKEGVVIAGTRVPSGGGRPVQEYQFNERHASVVLITATPEAHCTRLRYELLDLYGRCISQKEARFAQLHAESLDEWLDTAARRQRLLRICLPPGLCSSMLHHLQRRHTCPVQEYAVAESLASERENTLTLLFQRGMAPQGALRRHGFITPCPLLHLLPLPTDWETLDYADHTLVEEMLARLLQMLTCALNPASIDLHADFWNDRLISRLDFNLSTKLRGLESAPALHFSTISQEKLLHLLHRSIVRFQPV